MVGSSIKIENVSKRYQIGEHQSYGSLREVLANFFLANGGSLFRKSAKLDQNNSSRKYIWALKDVDLDVPAGQVLGVIGKNGAGKSTLLKILSRITRPTHGRVQLWGRVGSLLEVGTGFHPELTGRENIFLNGAILGMKRKEIFKKFDEIVAFAELDRFLDTPVKRYSSGMYMRLAFAVAAHLDPEILLVDEVLAVGDAAFQEKCLNRMSMVSKTGRTVLFVSHNLGAIRSLCDRVVLVHEGRLIADGKPEDVIRSYLEQTNIVNNDGIVTWNDANNSPGNEEIRLRSARLIDPTGNISSLFNVEEPLQVEIDYQVFDTIRGMRMILVVNTVEGVMAFASTDHKIRPHVTIPGVYRSRVTIPGNILNQHQYVIQIYIDIPGIRIILNGADVLRFTGTGVSAHGSTFSENWPGILAPQLNWEMLALENTPKSLPNL